MTLTFAPQFHAQVETGVWSRVLNPLAPFGSYPSLEQEKRAFQEAERIKAEGERIVEIDFKSR